MTKLQMPRRASAVLAAILIATASSASAYTQQELDNALALGCGGNNQPGQAASLLKSYLVDGNNAANDAIVTAVAKSCSGLILAFNQIAPKTCQTVSFSGGCSLTQ